MLADMIKKTVRGVLAKTLAPDLAKAATDEIVAELFGPQPKPKQQRKPKSDKPDKPAKSPKPAPPVEDEPTGDAETETETETGEEGDDLFGDSADF